MWGTSYSLGIILSKNSNLIRYVGPPNRNTIRSKYGLFYPLRVNDTRRSFPIRDLQQLLLFLLPHISPSGGRPPISPGCYFPGAVCHEKFSIGSIAWSDGASKQPTVDSGSEGPNATRLDSML